MSSPHSARPHYHRLIPAIGGAMLILVGAALLADQLGFAVPHRWMFLILLVPAAAAITDGFRIAAILSWRDVRPISRLIAGALFAAIGTLMFLGLNTGIILPALIISLGAGTIGRALLNRR